MEKILIVDDNPDIRSQLKWGLTDDYEILQAGNGADALESFKANSPRVVILDLGLPPHENSSEEGFRCLNEMLHISPSVKIIMLTGNNERENALKAMRMGAYDFYSKPPVLSELAVIIGRAIHLSNIEEQNRKLQRSIEMTSTDSWGMIGQCPEMQKVFSNIRKVASTNVPVLISGESGTGKELVAKALHEASSRKNGPFEAVNCGAIPENLLESELFGHEKGSFTGAHSTVQGKFQYADKGTLFLDEIGELPVNLQVKLLRFLQEGVLQRVGGRESIKVDTRTICATNININEAIKEGRFREDLFYRIGVIVINLPPLRERGKDVLLLANYYLRIFCDEYRKKVRRFSPSAISFLKTHPWPGNIRELRNAIQRAVIMSENRHVEAVDLGGEETQELHLANETTMQLPSTLKEAKDQVELMMISAELAKQGGNVMKSAEALGISRPTMYDLMKKHGLAEKTGARTNA